MDTTNAQTLEIVEEANNPTVVTNEDRGLIEEIKTLHLASYNAFLDAAEGWKERSIRIGGMLYDVRKRFFNAHIEHLKNFNEYGKTKAADLEAKEALADGLVKGAKRPMLPSWSTWLKQSGLLDVISSDTVYDYIKIYTGRKILAQFDGLSTLKGALAFLRAPKATPLALEAPTEGEEQTPQHDDDDDETEEPTPLERALQSFWRLASKKSDWTDEDREDFIYDLREREKFAREKGWLEA